MKIALGSTPGFVKVAVKMQSLTLPAGYPHTFPDGKDPVAYVQLRADQSSQCGRWDLWNPHCGPGYPPSSKVLCRDRG